jgi:Spy/CpxP family protein refolding chaperone
MTSLAEARLSGSRGRLVWLALALSLTLNVFFIGGLMWSHWAAPATPATAIERFALAAKRLSLSPDQHDALDQFLNDMREQTQLMRETNHPLLQQIWDELAKADPDQAIIDQRIDEMTQNRRVFQRQMTAALTHFLAVLSPEQRAQFVELARPRNPNAARGGR